MLIVTTFADGNVGVRCECGQEFVAAPNGVAVCDSCFNSEYTEKIQTEREFTRVAVTQALMEEAS